MDPRRFIHYAEDDGGSGAPLADSPNESTPPTWLTQVSPNYRDKKELHEYAKLNDLVDAHLSMKDRLSRAVIIPDPKTAKPEEVAAFKKTMGIPEKLEDYKFKVEKDDENGTKLAEGVRLLAASKGLTKAQAEAVFDFIAGLVKTGQEGQAKAAADAKASFPSRLLEAAGKDEKKAEEITNRMTAFLAKEIADPELVKQIEASGLLYSPAFATKLAAVHAKLGDSPYIDGQGDGASKGQGAFGTEYSDDFAKEYGK